jgi:hypothetical protein
MTAGRYDEACPKFAESQRLDAASGTLLNLAVCHEKQGKTASAWAEYNDVVAAARSEGNAERQKIGLERIHELEPKLCHLQVVATGDSAKHDLAITIDGVRLGSSAWGMAIPLDPGTHDVAVSVSGTTPWSGRVTLAGEGVTSVITVVSQEPEAPRSAKSGDASGMTSRDPMSRQLMYIFGGTGVVALGVGTFFGLKAKSSWDDRNLHCPNGACDDQAVVASRSARRFALAADVSVGVGLVGVGVAMYLALAPGAKRTGITTNPAGRLWLVPDVGRVTVGATF